MRPTFPLMLAGLAILALGALLIPASPDAAAMDPELAARLKQLRNLGKAFYENPGTQQLAVEQLRQAAELNPRSAQDVLNYGLSLLRAGNTAEGIAQLEKVRQLDPSLPHPYFNLGIEFKRQGETDRALAEFEQMVRLVPDEAKTHYNLGVLYKQNGENEKAIASFERAAQLDSSLAAPHFQMFGMLRRQDPARAKRELAEFQRLKALQDDTGREDVDWSWYSELYDPIQADRPPAVASKTQFKAAPQWRTKLEGEPGGLALLDADADRKPDVVAWSSGSLFFKLHAGYALTIEQVAAIRDVAVADFNNDGVADLAVVRPDGVSLLALSMEGRLPAGESQPLTSGDFSDAHWVDYDHDYDLDLMLVGADTALFRNNGDGTFLDVSAEFPFRRNIAALAVTSLELEEDNGNDIVIAYADGAVMYEDRKLGNFEPHPIERTAPSGTPERLRLSVADLNNDSHLDVAVIATNDSQAVTQILENHGGVLRAGTKLPGVIGFIDAQNRGWLDAVGPGKLLLNQGDFEFEAGSVEGLPESMLAAAAADFNADGKNDLIAMGSDSQIELLHNATSVENTFTTVSLQGTKNQRLAEGARVEVKAGRVYRKQVYEGLPLTFGLAKAESIDTVRITWPNGLVQNESQQGTGKPFHYEEKPRLSGSCPMIFTWNGREFEFISEVLGVAPLGAGAGGGEFFPVDHDEYVSIPSGSLAPRNGFYEVRVTEELREVAYLDQIKLLAVDHRPGVEIFTDEKFKGPPFPAFRLFGVRERHHPARAVDGRGRDVLDLVRRTDRRYPDEFKRDFAGRAERHSLMLDFPEFADRDDVVLFLHGWVDWADASTFVGTAQSKANRLFGPYLEVRDANGKWVKVIQDMGLPAGRPRTIAVDLGGKFLSDSREVRIVTNMCIYWDEVFAAAGVASPEAVLSELRPSTAELRFRGFSHLTVHPERTQPEEYDYARVHPTSMWNPAPGRYTRYGDVRSLLGAIDDLFVVMGAGDELALRFAAGELPALRPGWERDFLLFVDGWAKEKESNTAFGDSVEPLPFHAMTRYPYGPDERYPEGPEHQEYRDRYNTRPALRLIRPLR